MAPDHGHTHSVSLCYVTITLKKGKGAAEADIGNFGWKYMCIILWISMPSFILSLRSLTVLLS